jgi:hypothetical protein
MIDGKIIHAHTFKHANLIDSTYMATASLPLRYEIFNTGVTTSQSTFKQICSTVISDGGYELRGLQEAIGTPITTPVSLAVAGTNYPVISLRLKSSRLDGVVILTAISIMGITNNANYNWKIISNGSSSGGTWIDYNLDSSVQYKIDGGSITGGRILASGYSSASNQSNTVINIPRESLFKFQLERNSLTTTTHELSLVLSASLDNSLVHASIDWEEVSR